MDSYTIQGPWPCDIEDPECPRSHDPENYVRDGKGWECLACIREDR